MTANAVKQPKMIATSRGSPLDSIDIASKVFPFLGARELLNLVSCRKDYSKREYLTYHLVIRSVLMSQGFQSIHFLQWHLRNRGNYDIHYFKMIFRYGGKYEVVPDPIGILNYACGKVGITSFPNNNPFRIVHDIGEVCLDDDDRNVVAIQTAIDKNENDYMERAIWKQDHVDRVFQQIVDLLGDHPCREHVLKIRGQRPVTFWNPTPFLPYGNNFVYGTLDCVLDLKDSKSITKKQLLEASCELKKYYGEAERQFRILECLQDIKYRKKDYIMRANWREYDWIPMTPRWCYPEKRYTFKNKDVDNLFQLGHFLMNRDDDRPPAVIAKDMYFARWRRRRFRPIKVIQKFWPGFLRQQREGEEEKEEEIMRTYDGRRLRQRRSN